MATKFSARQSFTAKEPFGPLSHSNESHHKSAERKCIPKKRSSPLTGGNKPSINTLNECQIADLLQNILKHNNRALIHHAIHTVHSS